MPNPKTVPSARKPIANNGWIRKSDLDAWLDRHLPKSFIPCRRRRSNAASSTRS